MLVGACQFGMAWAGLRLNSFIQQATPASFTRYPSDTGVSAWKVKTGPAVLSPKPRPWRHHGAVAVTAGLVTADDTPVVRHPGAPAPEMHSLCQQKKPNKTRLWRVGVLGLGRSPSGVLG